MKTPPQFPTKVFVSVLMKFRTFFLHSFEVKPKVKLCYAYLSNRCRFNYKDFMDLLIKAIITIISSLLHSFILYSILSVRRVYGFFLQSVDVKKISYTFPIQLLFDSNYLIVKFTLMQLSFSVYHFFYFLNSICSTYFCFTFIILMISRCFESEILYGVTRFLQQQVSHLFI